MTIFESAIESFARASSLVKKLIPSAGKKSKNDDESNVSADGSENEMPIDAGTDGEDTGGQENAFPFAAEVDEGGDDALVLDGQDDDGDEDATVIPQEEAEPPPKKEKRSWFKKKPKTDGDEAGDGAPDAGDAAGDGSAGGPDAQDTAEPPPKKEKKEKRVREKKEKKKDSVAAADNTDDDTAPGRKKVSPALLLIILVVLLIPANVIFILRFISGDESHDSGDAGEQIIASDNSGTNEQRPDTRPVEDEQNTQPVSGESRRNISTTFAEEDLFNLIGANRQEVIEFLGSPVSESSDGMIFSERRDESRPDLIISLQNDGFVDMISLLSTDKTICGFRTVNSLTRIRRAMRDFGALELDPVFVVVEDEDSDDDAETAEEFHEFTFLYDDKPFSLVFIVDSAGNWLRLIDRASSQSGAGIGGNIGILGDDDIDEDIPQDTNELAHLLGRTAAEVVGQLGQPGREGTSQSGYPLWEYGTPGNYHLSFGFHNDRVFHIILSDNSYTILGLECGQSLARARTHLMETYKFIYAGDSEYEGEVRSTFMRFHNETTVVVRLTATEAGNLSMIIFTDLDTAQLAGARR